MIINNQKHLLLFKYWLITSIILVFAMIVVGGLTRLTDSGLSITEWELLSGVLPPLNDNSWNHYFSLYKKIPQYELLNSNMSISEFKIIFLWEYFHRLLGRFIGLFYLIPLLYFSYKKVINKKNSLIYYSIFFLILFQGFMGWYMVKSGLSNNISVSHYRLAAHLSIAFIIIALLYWNLLNLNSGMNNSFSIMSFQNIKLKILIPLILLQIIFGAFVSGLDAGKIYQTWPLMNSSYIPDDTQFNSLISVLDFNNKSLVQFIHRNLAYFIFFYILIISSVIFKDKNQKIKKTYLYVTFFLFLQIVLGIYTLLSGLNTLVALLHQITSVLLFLSIVRLNYVNLK
jgi:cytochrome c oxidase assembly protein subunit 15